jgi:pimeloyl-ACP methyl ester carboxylesterase
MADVTVNGIRFNVVRLGPPADVPRAGPPVVFIHGLIMDNLSSFYYTLAPVVARDVDVLCYDLRGHGWSERPAHGYRIEDAVDDLCGILDATGFTEPVQLVGNSFGGTIALAAALRAPERVAALGLVEAHPAFDGWADDMIEDLEDLIEGFEDPEFRERFASESRSMRRMIDCCEDLVGKSSMPEDFRSSAPTSPDDLGAIRCPSLLLYGEMSDVLDRALVLAEALPSSDLRIIEDCSHSLLMEAPDVVAAHLAPWLAGPTRAATASVRDGGSS